MKGRRRTVVIALVVTGIVSVGTLASASHTFTDVDDDHTFHDAIAWMQESGITLGCNPPANTEYCPDEFVTRGQMAAFFARAANSQTFDAGTLDGLDSSAFALQGEPAGDADTLDGLDSTDFVQQGDTASDSDLLDGLDSTDFVQQGDTASDSDLLDGNDSSDFLSSTVTIREVTEAVGLGAIAVDSPCNAGEIVTGGGFESDGGLSVNVTGSFPTATGWSVTGTVTLGGSITVHAICAATG